MIVYRSNIVPYNRWVPRRKTAKGWGGRRPGAGQKPIIKDRVLRSISFERADMKALEKIAEQRGISFSELIRTLSTAHMKRQKRQK